MIVSRLLRSSALVAGTCRLMPRSAPRFRCAGRVAAPQVEYEETPISLVSPTESSTGALASMLAETARVGDCLCLYGDVGAGKSVFSRAFIRAMADDPELPVPSPTYLLQNTYEEHEGPPVHHFDLYRMAGPSDLGRLSLEEAFARGVCLIEWAERLGQQAPEARLGIHLTLLTQEEEEVLQREGRADGEAACSSAEDGKHEEEGAYEDRRWRHITLVPHGSGWVGRCRELSLQLQSAADRAGLVLLPDTR